MFPDLDPKNPAHRAHALQERVGQLMRENGLDYTTAWNTANAEPEMQPFVAAMKEPATVEEKICRDVRAAIMRGVAFTAMNYAERAMAGIGGKWTRIILDSALFRPLSAATANAAPESIEMLAQEKVLTFVRAALDGAIEALSSYISRDAARREIYTDPMFAPMVDFVKRATGEDLRTGNAAMKIVDYALQHFIKGAVARIGLPGVRAELAAMPDGARFAQFLNGTMTPNTSSLGTLRPAAMSAGERSQAFSALVQKRMADFGETYNTAWNACKADPDNRELTRAMGMHN
jgi:hypothetical protein